MITLKHYLGLLGFLFAAAWIAFNFGYAVLCLVGAAVFYAIGAFLEGEWNVSDLQSRMERSQGMPR